MSTGRQTVGVTSVAGFRWTHSSPPGRARRLKCDDFESGKHSLRASAAVPGVGARVAPGGNLGQPAEVMGPAFRMAGALLGTGQAGVSQAQQGSVRLLDQVDLNQARLRRYHLATVPAEGV